MLYMLYIYIYAYIFIYMYTCMCVYIYIYTHTYGTLLGAHTSIGARGQGGDDWGVRTKILDFRGLDSSIILIVRAGILMPIGNFPEILSQGILVGIILVGRLGV